MPDLGAPIIKKFGNTRRQPSSWASPFSDTLPVPYRSRKLRSPRSGECRCDPIPYIVRPMSDVRAVPGLALVALAVLLSTGCSNTDAPVSNTQENERRSKQLIDQLRSLGYLDYAETTVEPGEDVVGVYDPALSQPGYSLLSHRPLCLAQLIDPSGNVVRSWRQSGDRHWSNAELLENGDLLVPGSRFVTGDSGPFHRYLMRLSWSGEVIWRRDVEFHHDMEVTPDGRILALTYRPRRISAIDSEHDVIDIGIATLAEDGEMVAEKSLYALMNSDPDIFRFQYVRPRQREGSVIVDLFHANSIEMMHFPHLEARSPIYALTNVLVSVRHQDTVAIINLEEDRVVWAWGQGEISGPHDATILENGHVLVFDNGLGRGWSRVVELDPLMREIVWEYRAPNPSEFYTGGRGSSQRLPNGNTLIANSAKGEAFEVTSDGEVVWRYLNPNAGKEGRRVSIVRIKRYPSELIDGLLKR